MPGTCSRVVSARAAATISADTTTGKIDIDNALGTAVAVTSLTTGTGVVGDTGNIVFDQSGGGDVTFTTVTTSTASVTEGQGDITLTNAGGNLIVGMARIYKTLSCIRQRPRYGHDQNSHSDKRFNKRKPPFSMHENLFHGVSIARCTTVV